MKTWLCYDCGDSFKANAGFAWLCKKCAPAQRKAAELRSQEIRQNRLLQERLSQRIAKTRWSPYRRVAYSAVARAKKNGVLPLLSDGKTPCADCNKPALAYDHRDYSKPLDVVPVCLPCNTRRGQGLHAFVEGYIPRQKRGKRTK